MKQILAERLLSTVMSWDDDQAKAELRPLMLLADVKYDEYHQFGPGMRFIERLALWLSQLEGITPEATKQLRDVAYGIVRDHLIFISSDEMQSLIGMAYPEKILPVQRALVAAAAGIDSHRIKRIEQSENFRSLVTRTLYLGLSDGSQVGMLRRMNPKAIDHEFTFLNYDLTSEKAASVQKKLTQALEKASLPSENPKFELLVLVDDFTASGTSFIRNEEGTYEGKLKKVIESASGPNGKLATLVDLPTTTILVLFYVSTCYALDKIRTDIDAFLKQENCSVTIKVDAVHIIPGDSMRVGADDTEIDSLLKSRFETFKDIVVDESYKLGDCSEPHRGFNSGDLALILFHNSPNNSLPILWFEGDSNTALFPRTTRHGRK